MSDLTSGMTNQPAPTGQAVVEGEAPQTDGKPVNLFESVEFRKYQSAQSQREARAAQENAELKKRLRDLETKDLSEVERLRFELAERDNVLAALAADAQKREHQAQMEELKKKDLTRLQKMSKVPMDDLLEAANYDEAMDIAVKFVESGQGRDEPDPNRTYIPSSKPSVPSTRLEQTRRDYLKQGDGLKYLESLIGG